MGIWKVCTNDKCLHDSYKVVLLQQNFVLNYSMDSLIEWPIHSFIHSFIALRNSGKYPWYANSFDTFFRIMPLVQHKPFERLILRLTQGKSTTGQLLSLAQCIEDGFQKRNNSNRSHLCRSVCRLWPCEPLTVPIEDLGNTKARVPHLSSFDGLELLLCPQLQTKLLATTTERFAST